MRILLLIMMMILASSASAGLYKWIDEKGSVHYSQKPPKNKPYKTIKAPPPIAKSSQLSASDSNETEETNAERTIRTETEKNTKHRAKNCHVGKNNLKSYQLFRRIRDKDGNIRAVSDKERATEIESAKQLIRDFCD